MTSPPRIRAAAALIALSPALLLPLAGASAAEVSPPVAACVTKALGSAAAPILGGDEKAMARLSAQERGRVEGCLLTNGRSAGSSSRKPPTLTVSPMDPAVVTSMSRFRSCAGHDFSGMNAQGQAERDRSMKHYLYVSVPWTATGSVPVQAPFSGTAIVSVEEDYPLGSWVRILHRDGWAFTAFHVDAKVRDGRKVRAGQCIATFPPANAPAFMPDRMGEPEANFDFSLQSTDGRLASFVEAMSPSARAPWAARGFTTQALTIARVERDARPCASDYPDTPGTAGFVAAAGVR